MLGRYTRMRGNMKRAFSERGPLVPARANIHTRVLYTELIIVQKKTLYILSRRNISDQQLPNRLQSQSD